MKGVQVTTAARLHLGFLDLAGDLGRRFGSIGLAIDAVHAARQMLATLSEQNRFAIAFRVFNMKTEAGRKKKIKTFVAMLARGETVYPQKMKPERGPKRG